MMLSTCTLDLLAQQPPVEKVREQFFAMNKSADGALKLYKTLENIDLEKDPVLLAYRGAASAASAGYVGGVRKKMVYFNRGKSELEKAVGLKPLDAEIRFLRLATQVNAPAFLGYSGDLKSDKEIILNTMKSVPSNHPNAYLYLQICRSMLTFSGTDAKEKNTLNQLILKFNAGKND
jgi:hypothetical protein